MSKPPSLKQQQPPTPQPQPQPQPQFNPEELAKMAERRRLTSQHQHRIQQAIFRVSERVASQDRSWLDAFIRHVSPSLCHRGDSMFPFSVKRHPASNERFGLPARSWLLKQIVGNAVLSFYEFVNDGIDEATLNGRVMLLEQIAAKGLSKFIVMGSEQLGYTLIHQDEKPVAFKPATIETN